MRVFLNVGSQEGDYASEQIVALEPALTAARAFFGQLSLAPELRWSRG